MTSMTHTHTPDNEVHDTFVMDSGRVLHIELRDHATLTRNEGYYVVEEFTNGCCSLLDTLAGPMSHEEAVNEVFEILGLNEEEN